MVKELNCSDDEDELKEFLPSSLLHGRKKGNTNQLPQTCSSSSLAVLGVEEQGESKVQGLPLADTYSPHTLTSPLTHCILAAQRQIETEPTYLVDKLTDLSQLRFHCTTVRGKSRVLPCWIVQNHDEATFLGIRITKKKDTIVQFLGLGYPEVGKYQAVRGTSLKPFNDKEQGKRQWSSSLIQMFLSSIPKPMRENPVQLASERLFLDKLLNAAIQKEGQFKENSAKLLPPPPLEEIETNRNISSPQSYKPLKRISINSSSKSSTKSKVTLRAGDKIMYHHPILVAGRDNLLEATITRVITGVKCVDAAALEMDNCVPVPLGHRIQVIERSLRGKMTKVKNPTWMYVQDFRLDPSKNEMMNSDSKEEVTQEENVVEMTQESLIQDQDEFFEHANEGSFGFDDVVEDDDSLDKTAQQYASRSLSDFRRKRPRDTENKKMCRPIRIFKSTRDAWESGLGARLRDFEEMRKRRRFDEAFVVANEDCCRTSLLVRDILENMAISEHKTEEDIVCDLSKEFNLPRDRLWLYLDGNPNNLIHHAGLSNMTQQWRGWLETFK